MEACLLGPTTNESASESNELGDAHNIHSKGGGTEFAGLAAAALSFQLLPGPVQLCPHLPLLLLPQPEQPLFLLRQQPLGPCTRTPSE